MSENEPDDFGALVAHYQALVKAIQFFEPLNFQHEKIQRWLKQNGLEVCNSPWHLPPAALWILIRSLEAYLEKLVQAAKLAKLPSRSSPGLDRD